MDHVMSVELWDRSGLEAVRHAAIRASRHGAQLEVVVRYRPPSMRDLNRWRRKTPEELRWRIMGAVAAETLAAEANAIAEAEGVPSSVHLEQM